MCTCVHSCVQHSGIASHKLDKQHPSSVEQPAVQISAAHMVEICLNPRLPFLTACLIVFMSLYTCTVCIFNTFFLGGNIANVWCCAAVLML